MATKKQGRQEAKHHEAAADTSEWHLLDAKNKILGRLASEVAHLLLGKHRADFAKHVIPSVNVIVINAKDVAVTGRKETQKLYRHHTGYPGHLKERTLAEQRRRDPRRIVQLAVQGMLPKNGLRKARMSHLKVYAGAEHPHMAQVEKVVSSK
ncbi:MAG: 50S ribosomal protein L13 [Patescibacteria group bacterium]